jgi:iron(III) transport system permease protein
MSMSSPRWELNIRKLEARALGAVPVVTALIVLVPIAFLLISALSNGAFRGAETEFTLKNAIEAYTDPALIKALWNSLTLGVIVAAISTAITIPIAWLLVRTDMPGKRFFRRVMTMAFYVSPLFLAIAWAAIAAPRSGFLSQLVRTVIPDSQGIGNIFTFEGIVFVSVLHYIPVSYLLISSAMSAAAGALEDAAHMSRAGNLRTFLRITLPLIKPTIIASLLQVSVFAAEQFAVPYFFGLRTGYYTLPTRIFADLGLINPNFNRAAAGGTMLLWFTLAGIYLFRRFSRQGDRYASLAGKASGVRLIGLKRWRWPAAGLVSLYMLLTVAFPMLALLWGSLNRFPSPTLTLANLSLFHWQRMAANELVMTAVKNSLLVSTFGALGTVLFCLFISFVITRTKTRGRALVDYATSVPLAVPSITLGLGFLPLYLWLPDWIPLFGTLFGLAVAFSIRFMGFAVRSLNAGLQQVHSELTEAAYMSRASTLTVVRKIQFPMLRPTIANTWVVLFVNYLQELNLTILLSTQAIITIPVLIFRQLDTSLYNAIYPLTLLLMVITLICVELVRAIPGYGADIDHVTRGVGRKARRDGGAAPARPPGRNGNSDPREAVA